MIEYTKGPWHFRKWAQSDEDIAIARKVGVEPTPLRMNDGSVPVSDDGKNIAFVCCQTTFKRGMGYQTECEERDANARLIAAAPALLEALEELLLAGQIEENDTAVGYTRKKARAAIKLAKGEA